MKLSVKIRKPYYRVKESFFLPLVLIIIGLSMLHFSQMNFDEDKVNQSLNNLVQFFSDAKKPWATSSEKEVSQQGYRPKRRPFSIN